MKAVAIIGAAFLLLLVACASPGTGNLPASSQQNSIGVIGGPSGDKQLSVAMISSESEDMEVYDLLNAFIQVFSVGKQATAPSVQESPTIQTKAGAAAVAQ